MFDRARFVTAFAALIVAAPLGAHAHHLGSGRGDCVSAVSVSSAGSALVGEFTAHGFGGGFIGTIPLPHLQNVTPPPSAIEADVVGALLALDFVGVLGGGTTKIRPIGGTGPATTHSGAQIVRASLFTGHFKAEPRTLTCESTRGATFIRYSYFELTLAGLLTPVAAGSPLQDWAQGTHIAVLPGDNNSQ